MNITNHEHHIYLIYVCYWCSVSKPKLFIILMLFHMRYTRKCLLFVLLLSLATIKNTFCNLVLLITQGEGDIIAITVQYSNIF